MFHHLWASSCARRIEAVVLLAVRTPKRFELGYPLAPWTIREVENGLHFLHAEQLRRLI